MSRGRISALLGGVGFLVLSALMGAAPGVAASGAASSLQYTVTQGQLTSHGTVNLAALASAEAGQHASALTGPGAPYREIDNQAAVYHPAGTSGKLSASSNYSVTSAQVPSESGFVGLTGPEQAAANGGIDLEPPDQGLCAGQGLVGEFINNAFDVYTPSGVAEEAPIPSYAIYGQPSTSFFSDPRCYYDAPTQRWFLVEFVINVNSSLAVIPPATQFVAVSDTFDPLGSYSIYSFDTTDTSTAGCPCFGDFDQLGVDDNGIYISTNEFGDSSGAYNGVIIYAFSKELLETEPETGISPTLFAYRVPTDSFGATYHIAPSQTPPGAKFAPNTEYFVESNSNAASDDHLAVYAMTDTSELATPAAPPLISTEIASESYAFPPDATQKSGPRPLGVATQDPEGQLQADFNAIQEVTYVGGRLYAEADTATAKGLDGAAWFVLSPSISGSTLNATVSGQGYVDVAGNNLIYPDIAVNSSGEGYMVFTLSGPAYYPSAAYIAFSPAGPFGSVHVAMAGADPEDSFTCYAAFVGPSYGGCRWGDYSMGVAMGKRVFLSTEVIPPTSRDYLTNWGTYVWSAPPLA